MKESELVGQILQTIEEAKKNIEAAEKWGQKLATSLGLDSHKTTSFSITQKSDIVDEKATEGVFDGQNMIDSEGKIYPVPANYASKSKLVPGDHLKLSIAENGAFIYKQIELQPRKMIIGHLILEGSQYQVLAEKKVYNVLLASVTFFKARVGDRLTIVVPQTGSSKWAAIENVIPADVSLEKAEADMIQ
jgi:hypothetical protein